MSWHDHAREAADQLGLRGVAARLDEMERYGSWDILTLQTKLDSDLERCSIGNDGLEHMIPYWHRVPVCLRSIGEYPETSEVLWYLEEAARQLGKATFCTEGPRKATLDGTLDHDTRGLDYLRTRHFEVEKCCNHLHGNVV